MVPWNKVELPPGAGWTPPVYDPVCCVCGEEEEGGVFAWTLQDLISVFSCHGGKNVGTKNKDF